MLDIFIPGLVFGYITRHRWLKRRLPYWITVPAFFMVIVGVQALFNLDGRHPQHWTTATLAAVMFVLSSKGQDRMPSLSSWALIIVAIGSWGMALLLYIYFAPLVVT